VPIVLRLLARVSVASPGVSATTIRLGRGSKTEEQQEARHRESEDRLAAS
jgi:hypothetical protein